MTPLYPLIFEETLKEKVWGGDSMGPLLGKSVAAGETIGESWEVSDHGNDSSIVANGSLAGSSLHELFTNYKTELMGEKLAQKYPAIFPLLIKFLDARDSLSIQVHPDDTQARELEVNELGKTECWYLLHAEEGATIIKGVKEDISKEAFKAAIDSGNVLNVLDEFPIKTGDFLFLPAGTIHAICSGTLIAEIQQNSDTTYRVFDYNRPGLDGNPRELHIEKTLAVSDLSKNKQRLETAQPVACVGGKRSNLNRCDKFWVDKIEVQSEVHFTTDDAVHIVMVVAGAGNLHFSEGKHMQLQTGMTVLIPASLESFSLEGDLEALVSSPV